VNGSLKVMLIFLQNMSLLLNKTPPADIRNHVLPMIARALEANQQQIQVGTFSSPAVAFCRDDFLLEILPFIFV